MILHRMTATFGRLNGDSLTLHEGLNVLTAPNEAGKSTWAAFLLSMLYGVDTAERATRTSLPVKTKYRPWSGRPMEGSLELTWEGRRMVIERTSQGRAPMAQFRAYDAATGRPAESGLTSVTVVADGAAGNGTMCDALSTALFVMGEDRALELWRSGVYDFDLILVTEDGRLLATAGIADRFRPDDSAGYAYEIVS